MDLLTLAITFIAGLVGGLALRPVVDRRRKLRSLYRSAARRQQTTSPSPAGEIETASVPTPRDYYQADRRERGTLAEGFGLHGSRGAATTGLAATEATATGVPSPRDYYEREQNDDEGILSEGYGLRQKPPPADAA